MMHPIKLDQSLGTRFLASEVGLLQDFISHFNRMLPFVI